MKFTTHLVSLDFADNTATFHLPAGTRMSVGTYSIELLTVGLPESCRSNGKPQPPTDIRLRELIGDELDSSDEAFLRYGRKVAAEVRAALAWEPQFDVMSPKQEELVKGFCAEIAGPQGQPGRPPDPVRLLEMAEALYKAEREECGP